MSKRTLLIRTMVAAAFVLGVLTPDQAHALRCLGHGPATLLRTASIVFRGEVVAIENVWQTFKFPDGSVRKWRRPEVTFRVTRVWKGSIANHTQVKVLVSLARFGRLFHVGYEGAVAAHSMQGHYVTNQCVMMGIQRTPDRYIRAFDEYAKGRKAN